MSRAGLAARLLAVDPVGLGGMWLRGAGPARDVAVDQLRALLPPGAVRRLPAAVDDERLLGGLDLGATLAGGAPVWRAGLLADADGGVLLIGMAERMGHTLAARIAGVMDRGEVTLATATAPARFGIVLLDDGCEEGERPPAALTERVAFFVDCAAETSGEAEAGPLALGPVPLVGEDALTTLAATAAALGVRSDRALVLALRAALASARLAERNELTEDDLRVAAELVLAPRATRLPPAAPEPPQPEQADVDAPGEDQPPPPPEPGDAAEASEERQSAAMEERMIEAARASLPGDLLARLADAASRGPAPRAMGAGDRRRALARGRPAGTQAGMPRGGARLSLIATLTAAAPWQRLRGGGGAGGPVRVLKDDLRVKRFVARAETTTIFVVDASGSSAAARLAEAKGAVELMLAQAHVTRTEVALIAFRGTGAELLLPPTRSLTRARRALAALPGGGGTPLAAGLNAARAAAEGAKAKGRTPTLVVLTDGRANVAADGNPGRAVAAADATAAARRIAAMGLQGIVLDISPRPAGEAGAIAAAMGLRYLALPRADSAAVQRAVEG